MKMWLIFCGVTECLIYRITEDYNYNILQFELIKCILYVFSFFYLDSCAKRKKWENEKKMAMNIGLCLILCSLSGVVSLFIMYEMIARIVLVVVYSVSVILLVVWMSKKADGGKENEEEKENHAFIKGISGCCGLATIGFTRIASNEEIATFYEWILLILIWMFLIISFGFFLKLKNELGNVRQ